MQRQRPIILEGPDGSGKSTLAAALSEELGLPVFHTGGPPADETELREKLRNVREGAGRFIFDRTPHISEAVYRRAAQAKPFVDVAQMLRELEELRPVVIYCRLASVSEMYQAISKDKKAHKPQSHLEQVLIQHKAIVDFYDGLMRDLEKRSAATVLRYSWKTDPLRTLVEAIKCAG